VLPSLPELLEIYSHELSFLATPYLLLCQEVDPVILRPCEDVSMSTGFEYCDFRTLSMIQLSLAKAKAPCFEGWFLVCPGLSFC